MSKVNPLKEKMKSKIMDRIFTSKKKSKGY